ncbi:MAG: ABC transporter substrate-binding protein [Acidimicrobiia bacterium]|nr:ABC transporter substrate-binding protein [Acidimicrobiia bacterium]
MSRPSARFTRRSGRTALTATLLALALAGAACSDDDDAEPSTGPASTGPASTAPASTGPDTTPVATDRPGGGDRVVNVGAVLEPTSLDITTAAGAAQDQVLLDNVYETLLTAGPQSEIQPGLAAVPDVSDDALVYTFTLQDGVTFHDGSDLTAADVVWSLDAFRAEGGTGAVDLASVASVEATDDLTVVLTLSQPDNDLLFNLTRRSGAVLAEDASGLENGAVGTGPFVFEEWNRGLSITLSRYDEYWGGPVAVGGATFTYYTDPNAAVTALTTGDVDILTGINTDLVGPLQDDPDFVVSQGTTNGEFTLGFNNSRKPLDQVEVRTAIRRAIDKQGLLELYNGYGTIIGSPVPPQDPWYEDLTGIAPYDPDAAAAALDAAGYGEGLELELSYPDIYPTNAAEYIRSELEEVGITVDIVSIPFETWLSQVFTNADYDMTVVLHVEPRDIANYANPDYYWRYDNPEVQQLIGDAKVAPTAEEATDLLKQATEQIAEDSPVDWLLLYADLTVATPDVTGYPTNDTASRFDLSGVSFTE